MKPIFRKIVGCCSVMASLIGAGCGVRSDNSGIERVSPREFQERLTSDSTGYLLDVRKPAEYAEGHLEGAHLLNWLDSLTFKRDFIQIDSARTIYIYCRSGRRSNDAAAFLTDHGYKVVDMDGGIMAWERDGLPVTKEE